MADPGGACRKPSQQSGPCRNASPSSQHPMGTGFTLLLHVPKLLDGGAPARVALSQVCGHQLSISAANQPDWHQWHREPEPTWVSPAASSRCNDPPQPSLVLKTAFTEATKPLMCSLDIKTYLNLKAMFSNKVFGFFFFFFYWFIWMPELSRDLRAG